MNPPNRTLPTPLPCLRCHADCVYTRLEYNVTGHPDTWGWCCSSCNLWMGYFVTELAAIEDSNRRFAPPEKMEATELLDIREAAQKRIAYINANRTKLVEAFIAETGFNPSECEIVETDKGDAKSVFMRRVAPPSPATVEVETVLDGLTKYDFEDTSGGECPPIQMVPTPNGDYFNIAEVRAAFAGFTLIRKVGT